MKYLKTLGCLLALLLTAVILFPATAKAADDIPINSTKFPDAGFRAYVKAEFDKNSDGKLSAAECKAVGGIYVENEGITSLKGVEYFPNLQELYCYGNSIASIDISGSPNIVLAYTDYWISPDADGDGTLYYEHALFPEEWDEEEIDPDPYGFYRLWIDETTKVTIKKPVIIEQPGNKKVGIGKKATFSLKAVCDSTLKYQWQYKKSGGSWTDVASAAGRKRSYSVTVAERHYGYTYRCKVSNSSGSVYSSAVKAVVPIVIKTQLKSAMVKGEGTKATVKVVAEGDGLKYHWWVSDTYDDGEFFSSSVKTSSYSMKMSKKNNGRKVYCVIEDKYGNTLETDIVTMTYVTAKPKITYPTAAKTITKKKGKTAVFTVETDILTKSGKTFQWQYRTSRTGAWKNVSAASGKTAAYKLTTAKKHNGYQYRCKVTNPYGSVYSKIYTLKVTS